VLLTEPSSPASRGSPPRSLPRSVGAWRAGGRCVRAQLSRGRPAVAALAAQVWATSPAKPRESLPRPPRSLPRSKRARGAGTELGERVAGATRRGGVGGGSWGAGRRPHLGERRREAVVRPNTARLTGRVTSHKPPRRSSSTYVRMYHAHVHGTFHGTFQAGL